MKELPRSVRQEVDISKGQTQCNAMCKITYARSDFALKHCKLILGHVGDDHETYDNIIWRNPEAEQEET